MSWIIILLAISNVIPAVLDKDDRYRYLPGIITMIALAILADDWWF